MKYKLVYYVYAYLREDGTPYYIGKGKGNRAFSKKHTVGVPHKQRIVFLETRLSDVGACALERRYIKWYGRLDLNTGILRNLTNGGDGTSGQIQSKETKAKRALHHIGRKNTSNTINQMSRIKKGRVVVKDQAGNRFSVPIDHPLLQSGDLVGINKGITFSKNKRYRLTSPEQQIYYGTFREIKEWCIVFDLSMSVLYTTIKTKAPAPGRSRSKTRGWKLELLDVVE